MGFMGAGIVWGVIVLGHAQNEGSFVTVFI